MPPGITTLLRRLDTVVRRLLRPFLFVLVAAACVFGVRAARADLVKAPPAPQLPQTLTLDEALALFHKQGLDLLIADAATKNAMGAVKMGAAIANPVATGSVGNAFTYDNGSYSQNNCLTAGATCNPWVNSIGISDSAAFVDWLSGKRDLRIKTALAMLASFKMARLDVERTGAFAIKAAYVNVVQAVKNYTFAVDTVATQKTTLKKFESLYKLGKIDEGALERIRTQELESEQTLDNSAYALRQSRIALAFLIGVRGIVPDYGVDEKTLDFMVPPKLASANEGSLAKLAFDHRPDLANLGYQLESDEANISLQKLRRFPDITVGLGYSWGGYGGLSTNGPVGAQIFSVNLTVPIPVFYQLDGEILQAEAAYDNDAIARAKVTAQIVNDVSTAWATFVTTRKLVERMEGPRRDGGGLLESSTVAFNVTALQYDKGAASLMDYLDALRTYIATKLEYYDDLASYWTAVYQVEEAVGTDMR